LELELSKTPETFSPEDGNSCSSQNAVVLRISGAGQGPENSLNFSVVRHRRNPVESAGTLQFVLLPFTSQASGFLYGI
jgi:hypothetical protein